MAIYVFKMKTFSRNAGSRGSRATSAAAYRAGERIRDLRTGVVYDHQRRHDVLHKEIIMPGRLGAATPEWARTRAGLWNAAESAETRGNARVAREFTLALPHELAPAARLQLAQGYAHQLSDKYGTAVDLVIHAPRGDPRNFHAHLLTTTREVTAAGLGRKAALELSGTERHHRGLPRWAQETQWLRESWATAANQALREAQLQVRVSHLPPPTPDLTRVPRLPTIAYYMERQGRHSFVAQRIRAQHQASLALAGPASAQAPSAAGAWRWAGQLRERVQAAWLGLRARLGEMSRHTPGAAEHPAPEPSPPAPEPSPLARESSPLAREPANPALESVQQLGPAVLRESQQHEASSTWNSQPVRAHAPSIDEMQQDAARAWAAYRRSLGPAGAQLEHGQEHELARAGPGLSASHEQQRDLGDDFDLGL